MNEHRLTNEFQGVYDRELERLGISRPDRVAIYNHALAPFGNLQIAGEIENRFLIPAAIKSVAGDEVESALSDKPSFYAQNMAAIMEASSKQWAWLLTEEIIAMQMSLPEGGKCSDLTDTEKATKVILDWFLEDLPRFDGTEQTKYYFHDEPNPGVRHYLDGAQLAVRACAIKTKHAIDRQPPALIETSVVDAVKGSFDYSPPSNMPICDIPTLQCLCGIRYCIYLIYSIDAAGS